MPLIGAHVSTATALDLSFDRAQAIGAKCSQIFISPPQQWGQTDHSAETIKKFLAKQQSTGIKPTVIHGIYLINLATDNPANLTKAVSWLKYSQEMAGKLNILGTIFHLGSHKGRGFEAVKDQVVQALKEVIKETPDGVVLMLENSAGAGGAVGDKFSELGELIQAVDSPKLMVCLDTQHAFVSGYDIRTKEGVEKMLKQFDEEIGVGRLAIIHANDSKTEFNSGKDRHENLGKGLIGKEGFKALINHPALQNIPFILEVPGIEGTGPDQKSVQFLTGLIK